jgi:hypothetical protein
LAHVTLGVHGDRGGEAGKAAVAGVLCPTANLECCARSYGERRRTMNPQRERAEKQRQVKLEAVAQQVAEGSLTIRQMTPEERKKYPKPDKPRPQRRRS